MDLRPKFAQNYTSGSRKICVLIFIKFLQHLTTFYMSWGEVTVADP